MTLKCRELTRMIASDELPEARWPEDGRMASRADVPRLPPLRGTDPRPCRRSSEVLGTGSRLLSKAR